MALMLLCLLLTAAVRFEDQNDRVVVNIKEEFGPVNPLLYGQNFGPWMDTSPKFVESYRQVRVTLLRFPAGEWGDENDITTDQLDDLADLARELVAEVSVQARLFPNGTPEAAAALVRYANVENSYGFKYWEIGNEPDLYIERENVRPGSPDYTPEWYSQRFREFHTAMKAVDPTILIAGPVVTVRWEDWMPTFIFLNGDIIDILSWHWYGHGDELEEEEVLKSVNEIEHQIETIRFWWTDPATNPKGYQRPMPLMYISEYDVSAASTIYDQLGTQVAALWAAEMLGRAANSGIDMSAHFALQGTHWHGLIDELDPDQYRPIFRLYQIFNYWGTTQISAESKDEWTLPAFASKTNDSVMVMVINQNPEVTREVEIVLQGARLSGRVRGWQLEQEGDLIALPVEAAGSSYTTNLPPYSITLFVFDFVHSSRLILNAFLILAVFGGIFFLFYRKRRHA
jgi:hypothetical protein